MNKEFVPYELALELKQLGFDEPCLAFYDGKNAESFYFNNIRDASGDYIPFQKHDRLKWFGAPTFSQAFRWFRDKRGLVSWISFRIDLKKKYLWYITDVKNIAARDGDYIFDILIESYEEAELACLKKLIEIANEQQ